MQCFIFTFQLGIELWNFPATLGRKVCGFGKFQSHFTQEGPLQRDAFDLPQGLFSKKKEGLCKINRVKIYQCTYCVLFLLDLLPQFLRMAKLLEGKEWL